MKKCENCGFEIEQDDVKFCPNCGCSFADFNNILNKEINIKEEKCEKESSEDNLNKHYERFLYTLETNQRVFSINDDADLELAMGYLQEQEKNDMSLNILLSVNSNIIPRALRNKFIEGKILKDKAWKEQKLEILKYRLCEKYTIFCYLFRRNESMLNFFDQPSMVVDSQWNIIVDARDDFYRELDELNLDINDFEILATAKKEIEDVFSKGQAYRNLVLPKDKNGNPIGLGDSEEVSAFEEGLRRGKEDIDEDEETENSSLDINEDNKDKSEDKKDVNGKAGAIGFIVALILWGTDNLPVSGGFFKTLFGFFIVYIVVALIVAIVSSDNKKEV